MMDLIGSITSKADEAVLRYIVTFITRYSLLEMYRSQLAKQNKLKKFTKVMLLSKDYHIRNGALLALGNLVLDGTVLIYCNNMLPRKVVLEILLQSCVS
jgi:hypothetical protein